MPNHCDQSVYIKGPSALVYELYHNLQRQEPRFCDVVLPVPFAQSTGMTGYDWRLANWGTKWDVADVELMEKMEISGEEDVAWFSFCCWTAWGPPIPVWDALLALGIDVEADYLDEGGLFEGKYQSGNNESWVPEEAA